MYYLKKLKYGGVSFIFLSALLILCVKTGSGKNTMKSSYQMVSFLQNPPLQKGELDLFAKRATTGDAKYIDFVHEKSYGEKTAKNHQADIDLIFATGNKKNIELFPPTSDRTLGLFSKRWRTRMQQWKVRNDGLLIKAGSASEYQKLYEGLKKEGAIQKTFSTLSERFTPTGYRLTNVKTGDIIFYRSMSKGLWVAIKVLEANNSGKLHIAFKVDVSKKKATANISYKHSLEMYAPKSRSGRARYIDFLNEKDYSESTAKNKQKDIDLIFATGGRKYVELFPPTSDRTLKLFSKKWQQRIKNWSVRNKGFLIKVGNSARYEKLYSKLKDGKKGIKKAFKQASRDFTPTDYRITNVKTGDIILFKSESKKMYVAMKVIAATNSGRLHIAYKIFKP